MRSRIAINLLAAVALLAFGGAAAPQEPAGQSLERWRHNPRERTREALAAWREGRVEGALEASAAARRLAPEDPLTHFNAGTLELAAGLAGPAAASLEAAAAALESAADSLPLAPEVHYNLGNARFDGGDAAGAVAAFEQALRLDPDHAGAKFNLELALRELERQASSPSQEPGSEGEPQSESQAGEGPEEESRGEAETPQPDPGAEPGEETERAEAPDPAGGGPRLENYEDQPDMTAEEAAAVLEAVVNLERQQRRDRAAERARSQARGGKDW